MRRLLLISLAILLAIPAYAVDYAERWPTKTAMAVVVPGGSGSVPSGGTTGQALLKSSATDYDIAWSTNFGAQDIITTGDVILANDNDTLWFGTAKDASITYDGTNLLIDSAAVGTGGIDFVSHNTTFIPIGASLSDAITSATAGDTLQLAAGTYNITSGIIVNKLLHIKGMGQGITTIYSTTDNLTMITMASAGSVLSDMTISRASATTAERDTIAVTASCDFYNISWVDTSSGTGLHFIRNSSGISTINIKNCSFSPSGSIGYHNALDVCVPGSVMNVINCIGAGSGGMGSSGTMMVYGTSGTINLYNCSFSDTTNQAAGVVQTAGVTINAYNCSFNGSGANAFDVEQTGGILTLYNTVLVNNKTSGTITYSGTVATSGLSAGTQTLAVTSPMSIDSNSNASCLRLFGLNSMMEIADIFVGSSGQLFLSTVAGSDMAASINLRSEDDSYGVVIEESDGTGSLTYANFYVVDAVDDYMNIRMNNIKSTTNGLFLTAVDYVGINEIPTTSGLSIDSNSNTNCIRLKGMAELSEIADIYIGSLGQLTLSTTAGTDTRGDIELLGEDDQYGVLIMESDGTGTSAYSNFYVTDATVDYLTTSITNTVAVATTLQGNGDLPSTTLHASSSIISCNLVNNAKGELIEDVMQIVGSVNIQGFWIFDETGATTTIVDRSGNSRSVTLGGNASTLSPSVAGLCPSLTMNGTSATSWSAGDNDAFSFGNGAGVDTAFSLVVLCNPVDWTNMRLMGKFTSATANREYYFGDTVDDKIHFRLYKIDDSTAYTGRCYNTAVTTDEGSWHCYIATCAEGSPAGTANCKIYRDGTQVDDTNDTGGAYAGMTNGTEVLGDYTTTTYSKAKYGVALIINKELTAEEARRLSDRLRSYAGVDI